MTITDTMTISETWNELVTVGLLGTDRRDPPALAPGRLGDLVADAVRPTPQSRLLALVAATVVARRCGAMPLAPLPGLQPPAPDPRPLLPPAAAMRWRELVTSWPVLETEWLYAAAAAGWRPPPDVLVALLRRHHRQPAVGAFVVAFGGSLASWLIDHVEDLAPFTARASRPSDAEPHRVLAVPPLLEPFVDGPVEPLAAHLVAGLRDGSFRWAHRTVVLNAVARLPSAGLDTVVEMLTRARPDHVSGAEAPLAMWESAIEVAVVRRAMLQELHRDVD